MYSMYKAAQFWRDYFTETVRRLEVSNFEIDWQALESLPSGFNRIFRSGTCLYRAGVELCGVSSVRARLFCMLSMDWLFIFINMRNRSGWPSV